MIVRKLDIWHLKLAFLYPIRHNLITHHGSENLVVKVTADSLQPGYGEGVPRSFVTGETLPASLAFLKGTLAPAILAKEFASPPQLLEGLRELFRQTAAARHPGAFCALETALLDAAGQAWGLPLQAFLGPKGDAPLTYSAVIPMGTPEMMTKFLHLVKKQQMSFLKLKVGRPEDLENLRLAREILGWQIDIRVDANCAWSPSEAVQRLREMQPYRISAVEQPVAKDDLEGLRAVGAETGLPIIADESLCHEEDAQRLIDLQACQIFNIRLSKCGGPGAASRIRQMVVAAGLRYQVGCHVGETSILSAAGRHFADCVPAPAYLEGSFSPFLFAREPVARSVVFGPQGAALPLPGPGLGIEILEAALPDLALAHFQLGG